MGWTNKEKKKEYQREWYRKNKEKADKAQKLWLETHPGKKQEYSQKSYRKNKDTINQKRRSKFAETRNWYLNYHYGISEKQYQDLAVNQNGKCAVCGDAEKLFVDHNHETGKVRALLCTRCNTAIGLLRENPEIVQKVKDYLEKWT